jgi:hypothetical protein
MCKYQRKYNMYTIHERLAEKKLSIPNHVHARENLSENSNNTQMYYLIVLVCCSDEFVKFELLSIVKRLLWIDKGDVSVSKVDARLLDMGKLVIFRTMR